jgi:hypothetical protein
MRPISHAEETVVELARNADAVNGSPIFIPRA